VVPAIVCAVCCVPVVELLIVATVVFVPLQWRRQGCGCGAAEGANARRCSLRTAERAAGVLTQTSPVSPGLPKARITHDDVILVHVVVDGRYLRWPKASYKVLSMLERLIPRRAAVVRSIFSATVNPLSC